MLSLCFAGTARLLPGADCRGKGPAGVRRLLRHVTTLAGGSGGPWQGLLPVLGVGPIERAIDLIMRCEVMRRRGVQGSSLSSGLGALRVVVPLVAVGTGAGPGGGCHLSLWWSLALASLVG